MHLFNIAPEGICCTVNSYVFLSALDMVSWQHQFERRALKKIISYPSCYNSLLFLGVHQTMYGNTYLS